MQTSVWLIAPLDSTTVLHKESVSPVLITAPPVLELLVETLLFRQHQTATQSIQLITSVIQLALLLNTTVTNLNHARIAQLVVLHAISAHMAVSTFHLPKKATLSTQLMPYATLLAHLDNIIIQEHSAVTTALTFAHLALTSMAPWLYHLLKQGTQ